MTNSLNLSCCFVMKMSMTSSQLTFNKCPLRAHQPGVLCGPHYTVLILYLLTISQIMKPKKIFACSKYLWKYINISSGKVSQNNTKEIASLVCFYQIMHNKASNKYQRGGEALRVGKWDYFLYLVHQTRRRRSGSFRKFDLFCCFWSHQSSCNPWQFILFYFVVEAKSTEMFYSQKIYTISTLISQSASVIMW